MAQAEQDALGWLLQGLPVTEPLLHEARQASEAWLAMKAWLSLCWESSVTLMCAMAALRQLRGEPDAWEEARARRAAAAAAKAHAAQEGSGIKAQGPEAERPAATPVQPGAEDPQPAAGEEGPGPGHGPPPAAAEEAERQPGAASDGTGGADGTPEPPSDERPSEHHSAAEPLPRSEQDPARGAQPPAPAGDEEAHAAAADPPALPEEQEPPADTALQQQPSDPAVTEAPAGDPADSATLLQPAPDAGALPEEDAGAASGAPLQAPEAAPEEVDAKRRSSAAGSLAADGTPRDDAVLEQQAHRQHEEAAAAQHGNEAAAASGAEPGERTQEEGGQGQAVAADELSAAARASPVRAPGAGQAADEAAGGAADEVRSGAAEETEGHGAATLARQDEAGAAATPPNKEQGQQTSSIQPQQPEEAPPASAEERPPQQLEGEVGGEVLPGQQEERTSGAAPAAGAGSSDGEAEQEGPAPGEERTAEAAPAEAAAADHLAAAVAADGEAAVARVAGEEAGQGEAAADEAPPAEATTVEAHTSPAPDAPEQSEALPAAAPPEPEHSQPVAQPVEQALDAPELPPPDPLAPPDPRPDSAAEADGAGAPSSAPQQDAALPEPLKDEQPSPASQEEEPQPLAPPEEEPQPLQPAEEAPQPLQPPEEAPEPTPATEEVTQPLQLPEEAPHLTPATEEVKQPLQPPEQEQLTPATEEQSRQGGAADGEAEAQGADPAADNGSAPPTSPPDAAGEPQPPGPAAAAAHRPGTDGDPAPPEEPGSPPDDHLGSALVAGAAEPQAERAVALAPLGSVPALDADAAPAPESPHQREQEPAADAGTTTLQPAGAAEGASPSPSSPPPEPATLQPATLQPASPFPAPLPTLPAPSIPQPATAEALTSPPPAVEPSPAAPHPPPPPPEPASSQGAAQESTSQQPVTALAPPQPTPPAPTARPTRPKAQPTRSRPAPSLPQEPRKDDDGEGEQDAVPFTVIHKAPPALPSSTGGAGAPSLASAAPVDAPPYADGVAADGDGGAHPAAKPAAGGIRAPSRDPLALRRLRLRLGDAAWRASNAADGAKAALLPWRKFQEMMAGQGVELAPEDWSDLRPWSSTTGNAVHVNWPALALALAPEGPEVAPSTARASAVGGSAAASRLRQRLGPAVRAATAAHAQAPPSSSAGAAQHEEGQQEAPPGSSAPPSSFLLWSDFQDLLARSKAHLTPRDWLDLSPFLSVTLNSTTSPDRPLPLQTYVDWAALAKMIGRSQPQHHVAPRGPADGALARLMVALGDACFLAWSGRGLAGPMHLDRAMDLRAFVKLLAQHGVTLKADDALWWDLQPFLTPTPTSTAVDVAALAEALKPDVPDFAPVDSAAIAQDLSSAARGAPHDAALVRRVVAALGPATRAMAPGLQGTRHVPWRRFEELCSQHGAAATPHLWSDLRDLGLATMSGFHSIAKHPASSSSSAPKPPATVVDFERLRRMVGPDGPTYLTGHRAPPSPAPAHAAAGPAPPRPPAQTSAAAARLRKRLLDSLIAAGYAQVLAHALQQSVVRAAKPLEQHRAAAAAYKVAGAAAAAAAAAAGRPRSPGASLSGLPPPAAPQDVATLAMGAELAGAPPPVGVPRDGLLPWRRLEGLLAAHGGALDPPLGPQDWSDLHAVGALKVTQTDTLVDWVRLCTEIRVDGPALAPPPVHATTTSAQRRAAALAPALRALRASQHDPPALMHWADFGAGMARCGHRMEPSDFLDLLPYLCFTLSDGSINAAAAVATGGAPPPHSKHGHSDPAAPLADGAALQPHTAYVLFRRLLDDLLPLLPRDSRIASPSPTAALLGGDGGGATVAGLQTAMAVYGYRAKRAASKPPLRPTSQARARSALVPVPALTAGSDGTRGAAAEPVDAEVMEALGELFDRSRGRSLARPSEREWRAALSRLDAAVEQQLQGRRRRSIGSLESLRGGGGSVGGGSAGGNEPGAPSPFAARRGGPAASTPPPPPLTQQRPMQQQRSVMATRASTGVTGQMQRLFSAGAWPPGVLAGGPGSPFGSVSTAWGGADASGDVGDDDAETSSVCTDVLLGSDALDVEQLIKAQRVAEVRQQRARAASVMQQRQRSVLTAEARLAASLPPRGLASLVSRASQALAAARPAPVGGVAARALGDPVPSLNSAGGLVYRHSSGRGERGEGGVPTALLAANLSAAACGDGCGGGASRSSAA